MARNIKIVSGQLKFEDDDLATSITLKQLAQGYMSSHASRHQHGGADEIDATGLTGVPVDSTLVHNTGDETIAGVKTFSSTPKMDAIAEKTAATGVTIDGILLKDDLDTSGIVTKSTAQSITGAKTFQKTVQTIVTATDGATVTFDLSLGNIQQVTLGGNRTLAVSNVSVGQCFIIKLIQDATGSRLATWFAGIKWQNGTTPTLTTTASHWDIFGFICTAANTYDGCIVGQNFGG